MEHTTSVILTLAFQDSTSRNYTFSGVDDAVIGDVKDKVLAINANVPANFRTTFVSNDGAQCVMIAAARIVVTEEEVIYNAG